MTLPEKQKNRAADWHNLYDTFNSNNDSFTKQVYHISSTISHVFGILLYFPPICQRFYITSLKDQVFSQFQLLVDSNILLVINRLVE